MRVIGSFFRLIRWPNLLFIVLTQWLFYFVVIRSLQFEPYSLNPRHHLLFYLLMSASIFIAAGGYAINDYFDLQIDTINKPHKVVVDRILKRRWIIVWHLVLSTAGIVISLYISFRTGYWIIAIANTICVLLLWFYSTHFKKQLLTGNLVISALTAWVIIVVYFFAGAGLLNYNGWHSDVWLFDIRKLYKLTIVYAGFAFIMSLIREVVKDMEDLYGDAQYQCRTMPLVWGIPVSKMFVAVWIVVCSAALFIIQLYMWQSGWWIDALYTALLIAVLLLYILRKLYRAQKPEDYHKLSNDIKWVMLTGILSMLFFLT